MKYRLVASLLLIAVLLILFVGREAPSGAAVGTSATKTVPASEPTQPIRIF
jgi:hypothetical protein